MKRAFINIVILIQLCLSVLNCNFQNTKATEIDDTENAGYRDNSELVLRYQNTEYQKATKTFIKISPKKINKLLDKKNKRIIYVFWGKASCPYCRAFVPGLAELSKKRGINIYYINTEKTDSNNFLKKERKKYKVESVPTLIKIKDKKHFKVLNRMKGTLNQFLTKYY
ncbi:MULTISPECIES: thioredoxin family protein [unclassified Lactobacillus]|uniref:TlpA family protein disulfide reductase n=1 Tax=unclassified Lactobacillus TaxID=2620435 RepID=UPI000EFCAF5A|nr:MULTISPECIES: thioredoxin family protein [unclassified Lactobacillus]RMC47471.1 thioredoxin [Lactobacillus sp. ESL0230]RMC51991.1 thioredoxin [Lactobacillus sp. ESL0225]